MAREVELFRGRVSEVLARRVLVVGGSMAWLERECLNVDFEVVELFALIERVLITKHPTSDKLYVILKLGFQLVLAEYHDSCLSEASLCQE